MAQLAGIEVRHRTTCATCSGGKCNCKPAYQASVWSAREGKRLRKTFPSLAAARAWRAEAQTAVRRGTLRAPVATTVREAGETLVEEMRSGRVRTRSGDRYTQSAIRSYDAALRDRIFPELGGKRLGDVQRRDVQRLADDLLAEGRDPSTIRNALMPLRVIYRRAVEDGDVAVNPCGRGELLALRWEDVDLAAGVIRVERSYDEKGRVHVEPKRRAGRRTVAIVGPLRDVLVEHKVRQDRGAGLVFGSNAETPFVPSNLWRRAQRACKRAGLEPIGLHEARHTFAAVLIAAGENAKAIRPTWVTPRSRRRTTSTAR
jgi:integrase